LNQQNNGLDSRLRGNDTMDTNQDTRIQNLEVQVRDLNQHIAEMGNTNTNGVDPPVPPTRSGAENDNVVLPENDNNEVGSELHSELDSSAISNTNTNAETNGSGLDPEPTTGNPEPTTEGVTLWSEFQDNIVTVFKELIVTAKTTFGKTVDFLAEVTFWDKVTFKKEVAFNADTVGEAVIQKGDTKVKINFEKDYPSEPIVTTTPMDFIEGQYKLAKVSVSGFTIEISKEQKEDIKFSWHAFSQTQSSQSAGSDSSSDSDSNTNTNGVDPLVKPEDDSKGGVDSPVKPENDNVILPENDNAGVGSELSSPPYETTGQTYQGEVAEPARPEGSILDSSAISNTNTNAETNGSGLNPEPTSGNTSGVDPLVKPEDDSKGGVDSPVPPSPTAPSSAGASADESDGQSKPENDNVILLENDNVENTVVK